MSNSPWIKTSDCPPPKDRTVLLWLAKARHGSRLSLSKGGLGQDKTIRVIDGLFHFDVTTPILAWREVDDLEAELPMELSDD